MLFLCYNKCNTCMKAKKFLDDHSVNYQYRDIKNDNPSFDELSLWYQKSHLELKKFFNTSGVLYKEMNLKDKLKNMSETDMLQLLSSNGMLVKRPILVDGDKVVVGFDTEQYQRIIGG